MGALLRNYHPLSKIAMESGYNGLQWEDFWGITPWQKIPREIGLLEDIWGNTTHWLKLTCKRGQHWAARGGLLSNHPPPDWNCQVRVGAIGCNGRTFENYPPLLKYSGESGLQGIAMGALLRNYHPLSQIAMESGYNGLQWEDFWGITPGQKIPREIGLLEDIWGITTHWLKLTCKRGQHWAARGGLLSNHPPPDSNCQVRVGCTELQGEDFWGLTLWLKLPWRFGAMGSNGRIFENLTPLLK